MNKLKTAVVQSSDEQEITAQEIIDIKTDLALENVDNTSDQNKPISTAQQNALDDKVDKEAGKGLSDENYTLAEKQKLALIEDEATANETDAFLLARANHTGTQSSETITHEATEGNVSGTSTLDPTTPLAYWNLTGNFELTGVTSIPLNENKVVTRVITTGTGVETLTIPAGWNVYGTFDPTVRNLATILIGNVASGVEVDVIFNQPN